MKMTKTEAFMYLVAVVTSYRDFLRREQVDMDLADGIRDALEALDFTVEDYKKKSRYLFNGQDIFKEDK